MRLSFGSISQRIRDQLPTFHRRSYSIDQRGYDYLLTINEVKDFMTACIVNAGADEQHASMLADVLIAADYRGHYSHGLNRLDMYINDLNGSFCKGSGVPTVLSDKAATAWVDGENLLGPVVGNFCMDLAIQKAQTAGVGWVVAKGSNHYGIAGHYAMQASAVGLLGMSFTNTSPLSFPTRSRQATMGTNPLSLAAPAVNNDSFVLDMATTTVALGKIELADRKNEKIPTSWAADNGGRETRDPKKVLQSGGLLPLGGTEITSGYKGYGLATMVEVFCGILSGANYGKHIRRWKDSTKVANLGQCFVAIDPNAFAPGFPERMQDLMNDLRQSLSVEKDKPVLVAGDPEKAHMKYCDSLGGIPYHANQITFMKEIGKRQNVPMPSIKKV
ncbi:malate/L-lactate dehydrogenase [Trichuris suis]|nr:malate/L-lactate dehydrogenase [Trichuris suis]